MQNNLSVSTVQKVSEVFAFIRKDGASILPKAFHRDQSYVQFNLIGYDVESRPVFGGPCVVFIVSTTIRDAHFQQHYHCEGGKFIIGDTQDAWRLALLEAIAALRAKANV